MNIALAQINFTVGDIAGNVAKITESYNRTNADLIIFSEMSVIGYPPEDLVLRRSFQQAAMAAVTELAKLTSQDKAMLVGGIWHDKELYNAAFLLDDGKIIATQYKHHLPNYGVFDEKRVFAEGGLPKPILWRGKKLGVMICEDMWKDDVATTLKSQGAELLISINASPYEINKEKRRESVALNCLNTTGLQLIYVNQIGGQDEIVFDGNSFFMSSDGKILNQMKKFEEDLQVIDVLI